MKPHKDPSFTVRIEAARKKLGFHYGVMLRAKYPQFQRQKMLNVVHNGLIDWDLLKALEDVAGIKKLRNSRKNASILNPSKSI